MTLPLSVRSAVLKVVRRLRNPDRECHVDYIGAMVLEALPYSHSRTPIAHGAVLASLRLALGLPPIPGSLARWARGKSREEVAQALEQVANVG